MYSEATRLNRLAYTRAWRLRRKSNPELLARKRESNLKYKSKFKEELKIKAKVYASKNFKKMSEVKRLCRERKRDSYLKVYNARQRWKRANDLQTIIRGRLDRRLKKALKLRDAEKCFKTIEMLGCSIEFFISNFESKFKAGMNWKNIHIDHIKPCAAFDLSKPEQQKECFNFSNLQPLFACENIEKSSLWNGRKFRRRII